MFSVRASSTAMKNMVELPGGTFRMGSERFYPEERPIREVSVDSFWIDRHLVTVAEFRRFIKATGHVTWAERAPRADDYPVFTWGDEFAPKGRMMANTWQGEFPWQNLCTDGYEGTSPVERFPPNGFGLYDMAGNVWEWTADWFDQPSRVNGDACCAPQRDVPSERFPRKVIKGGSHLCAPNYCLRYRPAARQAESVDTTTCHIGFRCVVRSSSA